MYHKLFVCVQWFTMSTLIFSYALVTNLFSCSSEISTTLLTGNTLLSLGTCGVLNTNEQQYYELPYYEF